MYHIYYENRFADAMRTCFSLEYADSIQEVKVIFDRFDSWESKYQPRIVKVYDKSGPVSYNNLRDMIYGNNTGNL